MRIAITGSTGLIGSYLAGHFRSQHHEVIEISRRETKSGGSKPVVLWDPARGKIESSQLEDCDVFIHLAGASIAARWSPEYKKILKSSRVDSTLLIAETISKLKKRPKVLISASAIGYYGSRPTDEQVTEDSSGADDFLGNLCKDWEKETRPAESAGVRVVHLRTGIVLARHGGALAQMLPIFNVGMGGVLGHGRQMMSWVALSEIPYIVEHIIRTPQLSGAVNMTAPKPVSNKEFTHILGSVIKRPIIFPVPAFAVSTLFGEMGRTLLLEGAAVYPKKLLSSGYKFRYDDLQLALTAELKA